VGPLVGGHPGYPQAELHVAGYVAVREQGVVLEHEAHAPLVGRRDRQVLVTPPNPSRRGTLQAGDGPEQGALAAPRRSQQHHHLALGHLEVDAIQHRHTVEGQRQALHS